ncbi:hypothetical protein [Halomonas faecis]|uniref:hypothetical protein n=1 Tax=Halomonas faecis TaxID=1562110 RepID=UPI0013D66749|nr:hypothetical protein [Halomonas faecis]
MAGSREAQFKRGTIEARTLHGWQVGAADGYDCEVEDFAELELSHYRLTKREERRLRLEEAEGDYGLSPVSKVGSGKPHDPGKQRLAEIIDRLNDLYGAEVSDDDKLYFFRGLAGRLSKDEPLMRQVVSHSEDQAMHGILPSRFINIIMDTMSDNEKMAMPLLDDAEMADKACRIIFKMLVQGNRDTNGKGF